MLRYITIVAVAVAAAAAPIASAVATATCCTARGRITAFGLRVAACSRLVVIAAFATDRDGSCTTAYCQALSATERDTSAVSKRQTNAAKACLALLLAALRSCCLWSGCSTWRRRRTIVVLRFRSHHQARLSLCYRSAINYRHEMISRKRRTIWHQQVRIWIEWVYAGWKRKPRCARRRTSQPTGRKLTRM